MARSVRIGRPLQCGSRDRLIRFARRRRSSSSSCQGRVLAYPGWLGVMSLRVCAKNGGVIAVETFSFLGRNK